MSAARRVSPGSAIAVLALLGGIALTFVASGYQLLELSQALIFAIAILGLNVLTGYAGQISLGHGAFYALGAFVSAILQKRYGVNFLLTIPLAGVVSGAVGFGVGLPALRLEGIYLALATFALAVAAPIVLKKPDQITGGVKGIILPPVTSPLDALTDDQFFFLLVLAIAAVLFLVAHNILAGRTGRALRAIRDGEVAAVAFGVDLARYKTLAFALSAFYGGVAGALAAIAIGFVSADAFPFQLSILLLIGAVLGGLGTLEGAVIGGLFVLFLPVFTQQALGRVSGQLAHAAPTVTQGVILLVVMLLAREGIAGLVRSGYSRLRTAVRGRAGGPEEIEAVHETPL